MRAMSATAELLLFCACVFLCTMYIACFVYFVPYCLMKLTQNKQIVNINNCYKNNFYLVCTLEKLD